MTMICWSQIVTRIGISDSIFGEGMLEGTLRISTKVAGISIWAIISAEIKVMVVVTLIAEETWEEVGAGVLPILDPRAI